MNGFSSHSTSGPYSNNTDQEDQVPITGIDASINVKLVRRDLLRVWLIACAAVLLCS